MGSADGELRSICEGDHGMNIHARNRQPTADEWTTLSRLAWGARDFAHVYGKTRVGAAVVSAKGGFFTGCNVEHRFRSHDVHAEVSALTSMIAAGDTAAIAVVVATERERFTPCGACLDWIFELGGPACIVAFESTPGSRVTIHRADELMPYYPY
jgi:cytidine deaminase